MFLWINAQSFESLSYVVMFYDVRRNAGLIFPNEMNDLRTYLDSLIDRMQHFGEEQECHFCQWLFKP